MKFKQFMQAVSKGDVSSILTQIDARVEFDPIRVSRNELRQFTAEMKQRKQFLFWTNEHAGHDDWIDHSGHYPYVVVASRTQNDNEYSISAFYHGWE